MRSLAKYYFNPELPYDRVSQIINMDSRFAAPLFNVTAEFCAAFNLRVDGASHYRTDRICLVTENGFNAGAVGISSNRNSEIIYNYMHWTVKKSRGGDGRSSKELPSLIRAVKKNEEIGTDQYIFDRFTHELSVGLNNIKQNKAINITSYMHNSEFLLNALEILVGTKEVTHEIREKAIGIYNHYNKDNATNAESDATKKRFMDGGFYAIGLANDGSDFKRQEPRIYIGDISVVDRKIVINSMKAGNSLGNDFFITTAMSHAKTKYEGINNGASNEYRIPFIDKYDDELDMVVAYSTHEQVWVLIPKVAP